ncbi:MAG TPA: glycosyltransferase family 39 protein [Vicinamibacterales bacterium]|nr:glycosyltransferase family 39 protein [Vicinamibacterales bacterium]
MQDRRRTVATLIVLGVVLPAAAAARLWGIGFCLPHPHCRPDEDAISAIAGGFVLGEMNPHIFNYPALFMLAVAAAVLALPFAERVLHKTMPFHFRPLLEGIDGTTRNYMVARFLSAAAGIASVWVLFRIGLRLFDRTAAVAGSALLALAFLHVRDSHYGVTDVPMAFMVLVAFLCAVRLSASGSRGDLALAGVTAGLATSTKYNAALVCLPALFAAIGYNPRAKSLPARLADAAILLVLMTAAFLCTSPYSLLDYPHFIADLASDAAHLSGGHGVNLGRGWGYHAMTTLRYGVGMPILVSGVAGLVMLLVRTPRTGVLVALFPVTYYAVLGSGYTVFTRHMVPVVPFLCLAAGYLIAESAGWISVLLRRPRWQPALTALAVALALWPSVHSILMFDSLIARADSRLLARQWVEHRFPAGTTIAQLGPEGGYLFLRDGNEVPYTRVEFSRETPPPQIVVVPTSPAVEALDLRGMDEVLRTDYVLALRSDVDRGDPRNVFDLQDEFYLPFAGFHQIERPGPNLKVYVRRDVAWKP